MFLKSLTIKNLRSLRSLKPPMNPIALIKLSILCLAASDAFHPAEAFEVRNEPEFKKIFPEDAKRRMSR